MMAAIGWRKRQIIDEEEYDVSIDVLTKHRDKLWKMTQSNMNSEFMEMGIMDDIRLSQIEELDESIGILQKSRKTALNTSL
jgi:hypothetical protein